MFHRYTKVSRCLNEKLRLYKLPAGANNHLAAHEQDMGNKTAS